MLAGCLRFVLEALSVGTVLSGLLATTSQLLRDTTDRRGQCRCMVGARITFGT